MGKEWKKIVLKGKAGGLFPVKEYLLLCHEYRHLILPGSICQHWFCVQCVEYDLYYRLVNFKNKKFKDAKLEIFQITHLTQLKTTCFTSCKKPSLMVTNVMITAFELLSLHCLPHLYSTYVIMLCSVIVLLLVIITLGVKFATQWDLYPLNIETKMSSGKCFTKI